MQYKHISYNRPHPLYCPQFLQDQHKIERISCLVEGRCPDNRSPDKRGLTVAFNRQVLINLAGGNQGAVGVGANCVNKLLNEVLIFS